MIITWVDSVYEDIDDRYWVEGIYEGCVKIYTNVTGVDGVWCRFRRVYDDIYDNYCVKGVGKGDELGDIGIERMEKIELRREFGVG